MKFITLFQFLFGKYFYFRIRREIKPLKDPKNERQLDGNGQMFLCMQDLCLDNFLDKLRAEHGDQGAKRALVVFTDEEWDIKKLRSAFGEKEFTNRESVLETVQKVLYNSSFSVVRIRERYKNSSN